MTMQVRLRDLYLRVACVPLESGDHGVEARLARGQADALHQRADEISRYSEGGRWRLAVHRPEDYGENGCNRRRLADVEIGVEIHPPVTHFGNDVHARLTFRNVERSVVDVLEPLRQWLEFLRVLNQCLHLLLASHRAEQSQHSIDGRRNARAGGGALHKQQSNYVSRNRSSTQRRAGCQPGKRLPYGKADSSPERAASRARAGRSALNTTSARGSKAERDRILKSCSPRRR